MITPVPVPYIQTLEVPAPSQPVDKVEIDAQDIKGDTNMENGSDVKEAEVTGAVPEAAVDVTPVAGNYIGGKIEIIADAKTGAISVSHPQNIILALGIIETAKSIIVQKQQEAIRKVQEAMLNPKIFRAGPQDVKNLRPS